MYEDFKGVIVFDTVDHFATFEQFAKNYGVDTDKFDILEVKFSTVREKMSLGNKFIIRDKENKEIQDFYFEPKNDVFSAATSKTF